MLTQIFSGNLDLTSVYMWAVALILAITIHEAAHAFVADRLGDLTARYMGRLTLNPLAHLDPIGTILLVFVGFGWGKPVPFNPVALRNPALGGALISLAGPTANFVLALATATLIRLNVAPLTLWGQITVINIMLGLFNLLPFSPLDGEKVVAGFLPHRLRASWAQLQTYGIFFLIIFIFSGGGILSSLIQAVFGLFTGQNLR